MKKSVILIILPILLFSFGAFSSTSIGDIFPITPGLGVDTDIEMDLEASPMDISYATAVKQDESLFIMILLKNNTEYSLSPSMGYSFAGYHNDKRILRRGVGAAVVQVVKPGQYLMVTHSYPADDPRTISFINKISYSQNFSKTDETPPENLILSGISQSNGAVEVELKNTSEDQFIELATFQLFFVNQKDEIVGWEQFYLTDTVVPGAKTNTSNWTGGLFSKKYANIHDSYFSVKNSLFTGIDTGETQVQAVGVHLSETYQDSK